MHRIAIRLTSSLLAVVLMAVGFSVWRDVGVSIVLADCPTESPGCWQSVPVPCNAASCSPMSTLPPGDSPTCGDNQTPTRWSLIPDLSWTGCKHNPGGLGSCEEALTTCGLLTLYIASPCNSATRCEASATQIKRCSVFDVGGTPACP